MAVVTGTKGALTVKAYAGDAKTLLAFSLDKVHARDLAGFTIHCAPQGHTPYYLFNTLQFEKPGDHAQDASQPANASINAPIHGFRWLHVPGSTHQGTKPFRGTYVYTVTPRYFDAAQHLLPLDPALGARVTVSVLPFKSGRLEVGFTRGFMQSQAFVHHFGKDGRIVPKAKTLLFDTSQIAGTNAVGETSTYADVHEWMGYTAREKILGLMDDVLKNKALRLDMFAYDLNEPVIVANLLKLAAQGRVRLVLDNASLHHSAKTPEPEDEVEKLFRKAMKKGAGILRGHFSSYAHDKVMIVSGAGGATRVLTGSTNFSVTGMYVNSNHVLVFNDASVAKLYARVFDAVWDAGSTGTAAFQKSDLGSKAFPFASGSLPNMSITFAPHANAFAESLMADIAARIAQERTHGKARGSVLFAVMDLVMGGGPVRPALTTLHGDQAIFSYGISDSVQGIRLYVRGKKNGVLVTGKPTNTMLPPPFDQVPGFAGHQVHHKFVICGFNTANAVVYCGSSNLATGGEEKNGDNLLEIHDADVATAFAIEAFGLVDHFNFLDRYARAPKGKKKVPASKSAAAAEAKWFLSTGDGWVKPYFDPADLKSVDRQLFG